MKKANRNSGGFRLRPFISLALFFNFVMIALSGLALYLRPEGSVARWTGWALLGLDKKSWEGVHAIFCITFVMVAVVHLGLNWKTLIRYLREKAESGLRLRWEWVAALALMGSIMVLSVLRVSPFYKVMELRSKIKDGKGVVQIEAPEPGFENRSLAAASAYLDLDVNKVMERLRGRGLAVPSPSLPLEEIARLNRLSPQELYEKILDILP
jgi:hypothetical protein